MTALRAVFPHQHSGEGTKQASGADHGLTAPGERRRSERRSPLFPVQSRETRLRLVERASGIGAYDLNWVTGENYWSPELKAIAGLPQDDSPVSPDRFASLLHPEDRKRFIDGMAATRQSRESTEFEGVYRLLRADGTPRWITVKGRTFFAGAGSDCRPVGTAGIVMDITSGHATEMALARNRAELAALLGSAIDAIIGIDGCQRIVLFNPAACRMFRCTAEEAGNTPPERFIPADLLEVCREQVRQAAREGLPLADQPRLFSARRADGERFPIEVSIARVEVGGRWPLMLSIRDVSERQEAEDMLRRLKAELANQMRERPVVPGGHSKEALESSNRRLQQFAYIAAHDLQAPLRSIKGFALMLQNELQGQLGPQGDTWLNYLLRSTQRMQILIQDLLTYSQVDSHGKEFEPTDFGQLFDDVVMALDAAIRESGAEITRDDLPVVLGDRTQLGQLLQNLIGNGIKYCGGKLPRVHVSSRRNGSQWVVSVRDNGIGIQKADQEGIFELFRRLHTQMEYPGTGIGLAVCRRVIQRHGGRIWVESEPGQGSIFHFSLPEEGAPPSSPDTPATPPA